MGEYQTLTTHDTIQMNCQHLDSLVPKSKIWNYRVFVGSECNSIIKRLCTITIWNVITNHREQKSFVTCNDIIGNHHQILTSYLAILHPFSSVSSLLLWPCQGLQFWSGCKTVRLLPKLQSFEVAILRKLKIKVLGWAGSWIFIVSLHSEVLSLLIQDVSSFDYKV